MTVGMLRQEFGRQNIDIHAPEAFNRSLMLHSHLPSSNVMYRTHA